MEVAHFTRAYSTPTSGRKGKTGMRLKSWSFRFGGQKGFTLVELMVVVSILAILSAVAVPSYINYVNRTRQSEAAGSLMTARLEMEEFFADNGYYASTIQCLPSFVASANTSCLANCKTCSGAGVTVSKPKNIYTFYVAAATNSGYRIAATRQVYTWAADDNLTISARTDNPVVQNTDALKFSVFQWLFQ